ncbi:C39 family peptidase [Neisseria leonii]|uniref:C39 family peptidase n=1 Tax=Neisseria leonii TaxID=2995413 RepID=A0A9X4E0F5_9NEIS|nr:C39 family peptidase [Neisseria sp. 51.81]MDD9327185.1 C39 family peptidase [Neisseria sp. 51.81]
MKKCIFFLFLLPEIVFANPTFNANPIAYQKIQVQSWKAQRDFGIVKQDLDFSCGAASVATLLNNFYGQNLTEEEILNKMDKTQMQASFDDMQRIMPELGFKAKGYALPFEQLVQLKIPVVVYLKYRKNDHFSVLRGINDDTVWLADSSWGHVSMSKEQFLAAWQTRDSEMAGKILAIVPTQENITPNGAFFVKNPTRKTQFITQHIQSQHPV